MGKLCLEVTQGNSAINTESQDHIQDNLVARMLSCIDLALGHALELPGGGGGGGLNYGCPVECHNLQEDGSDLGEKECGSASLVLRCLLGGRLLLYTVEYYKHC